MVKISCCWFPGQNCENIWSNYKYVCFYMKSLSKGCYCLYFNYPHILLNRETFCSDLVCFLLIFMTTCSVHQPVFFLLSTLRASFVLFLLFKANTVAAIEPLPINMLQNFPQVNPLIYGLVFLNNALLIWVEMFYLCSFLGFIFLGLFISLKESILQVVVASHSTTL